MSESVNEFTKIVGGVLRRFFEQNAQTPLPAAEITALGTRLHAIVAERGLPRPLAAGEAGTPGGMAEAECAPLVARVAGPGASSLLVEAAKQLVKACFYPEFTVCRDSYRETGADGSCRRQELARVRSRISGTHCVDCPHWVALGAKAHETLLESEWCNQSREFAPHRAIFLPEDFRALRLWLHAAARRATRT